jgi:hypothetical protein
VYFMLARVDAADPVWRWDLADDSVHPVTSLPRATDAERAAGSWRPYYRLPGYADRFFSLPGPDRTFGQPYTISMHSGGPEPEWTVDVGWNIGDTPDIAGRPDGSVLYITSNNGLSIVAVDLETGTVPGSTTMPTKLRAVDLAMDRGGRYLVAGGSGLDGWLYGVRDTERREWVGMLGATGVMYASRPVFSRDGRFVITAVRSEGSKWYDKLAVWDVSAITGAK